MKTHFKLATGFGALAALALCGQTSGCNEQAAIEMACTIVETAAATPSIALNVNQQAGLNAAVAACKATQDGANMTAQTDTVAILSAAAFIQPLLNNIHIRALAPEEAAKVRLMRIDSAKLERMARRAGLITPAK